MTVLSSLMAYSHYNEHINMFHEVSNGSMWFHMILCGFTLVCMVLHGLAWFHVVSRGFACFKSGLK